MVHFKQFATKKKKKLNFDIKCNNLDNEISMH